MQRKQILAKAITLGLLLAMPCSAWAAEALNNDYTLTGAESYSDGLVVNSGVTLNGDGNNLVVTGTAETKNVKLSTNIFEQESAIPFGIVNNGSINNVLKLEATAIYNTGKLEVEDIKLTSQKPDNFPGRYAVLCNSGENAEITLTGSISDGTLWGSVINTDKAVLNLNGVDSEILVAENDDGAIRSFFVNVNGAVTNVNANTIFGKPVSNSNAIIKVKEGVALKGFSFSNANSEFHLDGNLEAGLFSLYNSTLYVGNNATIKSNNNDRSNPFDSRGSTIYAATGILNIESFGVRLSENTTLKTNETDNLKQLNIISGQLENDINLIVNDQISADSITNTNVLETNNLIIKKGGIDESGDEILSGNSGNLIVHDTLTLESDATLENLGNILLDNDNALIKGQGSITNYVLAYDDYQFFGIIAKSVKEDGSIEKIEKLTIEGTLNNESIIAVKTLDVANGEDNSAIEGVKTFDVDNLNILDEGSFTLNGSKYEFTSVGVGEKATFYAANSEVTVEETITLDNTASFTAKDVSGTEAVALGAAAVFDAASLAMAEGGAVVSNGGSLTADKMNGEGLTFDLQSNKERQIDVAQFTGNDLKINVTSLTPEQVVIDTMNGSGVTVTGDSQLTDTFEVDNVEAGLQALAYTASVNSTQNGQRKTVIAPAGKILGDLYGETDGANHIITASVKEGVNNFNQGISEMASIALMTWRQENNDMNKRLGELRDSAGEHGVWVRMTRGEAKYGNQNIKNQYNAYQLGYDEKLSVDKHWTVGAALTYTDAESSFSYGKGENKHKGLALYGSRLNDDGSFIDLIARYARLEHDYEVYGGAGKGDFDTNGYSLSAEYGKRFTQKSGLWIEPQVELTYGRVSSGEYLTNNGVRVRQEGMDSVVGRLGFALGKNLAQGKGNVYLRASYLYDFDGETDVRYSYGIQNKRFEQDLGGGWWEVGVGTNINFSEAAHLYFDIEKTYGGNVATPWQWNAGVRWSF